MRDAGLESAIKAVGGVAALAKGLGIAQPSVSNWQKIPAERVLAVENISGISRHALRPDLYPSAPAAEVDEIDRLRAAEYGLIARLLFKAPTAETLQALAGLKGDPTPLGMAHIELANAAREISLERAGRDYFDLFVGVGRSELLPYASYYLTGFLHERPLAAVRGDYVRLGIIRDDTTKEPEDHLGLLFDVMAALALRRFGDGYADEKAFFEAHIRPWAGRFFADLEAVANRPLYGALGAVGRIFVDIETEAFTFDA